MDVLQSLNNELSKGISHFLTFMNIKIKSFATRVKITDPSRGKNRQFNLHTIVLKLKERLCLHIKFIDDILAGNKTCEMDVSDLGELLDVSVQLDVLAGQFDDHINIYKSIHIDVKRNFKMLVDELNIEKVSDKADTGISTPSSSLDVSDTNATKIVDCSISASDCGNDYPPDCFLDDSGFISSGCLNNDSLFDSDCKLIDSNIIQVSSDVLNDVPNNSDGYIFEGLIPQISDQGENDDLFISNDFSKASLNASLDIPLNSSCNVVLENDSACIIDSAHESINKEIDSKFENQSHVNNFDFPLINNGSINAEIIFIKVRTDYLLFCSTFEADGKSAITDFNLLANGFICQHVLKFSKMCFTVNSLLTKGLESVQHYINQRFKNTHNVKYQVKNDAVFINYTSSLIKIISDVVKAYEDLNFKILLLWI